jgi:hypothetical protein
VFQHIRLAPLQQWQFPVHDAGLYFCQLHWQSTADKHQKSEVKRLLSEYSDVFDQDDLDLGNFTELEHAISSFFSETTGPIGTKLSRNVPWIGTKNLKFVEDHPMNIHVQFGYNHICSFWEEGIWTFWIWTFSHRVQCQSMSCGGAHLGFPNPRWPPPQVNIYLKVY